MAVEKMQLVDIAGRIGDIDEVVRRCIINQEFHPENAASILKDVKGLRPYDQHNPYDTPLKLAVSVSDAFGIALGYRDYEALRLSPESCTEYLEQLRDRLNRLREQISENKSLLNDDRQVISQLEHLRNLNTRLDDLFHFNFVKFRYGRLPKETYEIYSRHIDADENVIFITTSSEHDYLYGLYVASSDHASQADALFASMHFERIRISDRVYGTPQQAMENLTTEIAETSRKIEQDEALFRQILKEERERYLSVYSYLRFMSDSFDVRQYALCSQNSFFLFGWVPKSSIDEFTRRLDGIADLVYTTNSPDPTDREIAPPTKLKNNFFARPFEFFITMYGLPSYNEIDPTFFMSLTYVILFGMMFGDLGQGFVLFAISFVLRLIPRFKKLAIAGIFPYIGISSMAFGLVYGSFFGNEEILTHWYQSLTGNTGRFGFGILESSSNTNTLLVLSIGVGILLMSVSMVFNIINGIRQKDYEKTLFSSKGLAGFVLYWSVLLGVILIIAKNKAAQEIFTLPYILGLLVIPLILIFLAHPLGKLLKGYPDWIPRKKGDYVLSNVFELFEVVISFLSNTISFIRVGALALNHAGMMMVVYILAHSVGNAGNSIVLIIGNVFVMVLEGFIVGIQVLRLEFYELFGKFYSGNGKPYRILKVQFDKKN